MKHRKIDLTSRTKCGILAIDLGNTIIDKDKRPFPHALRVIKRLKSERFKQVVIISKVTPEQEVKARIFLESGEFTGETGISMDNVYFCAERNEKGPICRDLHVAYFLDDRPEGLVHAWGVEHRILYNPTEQDCLSYEKQITDFPIVRTWLEVEGLFFGGKHSQNF